MRSRFLILALAIPLRGFCEDSSCETILARGVYDNYISNGNSADKTALKKWLCNTESGTSDSKGDLGVDIPEIIVVGAAGGHKATWKNDHCDASDYAYDRNKSASLLIQQADPKIVDAWKACMLNNKHENLICTSKEEKDFVTFTISYNGSQGIISESDVSLTFDNNLIRMDTAKLNLKLGEKKLTFKKKDSETPSIVTLSADGANATLSCEYFVPATAKTLQDRCEDMRKTSFKMGQITQRTLQFWRTYNKVPIYNEDENPNSGIAAVGYCYQYDKF